MKNEIILQNFLRLPELNFFNKQKNLSVNNKRLFSYNLKIAEYKFNILVIYNYTAKGIQYYSNTTSNHINRLIDATNYYNKNYILINNNNDAQYLLTYLLNNSLCNTDKYECNVCYNEYNKACICKTCNNKICINCCKNWFDNNDKNCPYCRSSFF